MARSKFSAALAAFALIGVSVFAGAAPAWAAPPAPDLNLTGGWTSDNSAPYISGRVDHLAGNDLTVEVRIISNDGPPSQYCVDTLDYTDPLQTDAPFECLGAGPMPLGTNEFYAVVWETAIATDPSLASASTFYYVGGTQGTVITSPAPETDSRDATPTFAGTGPSLGSVTVNEGATALCTSAVALDGSWSCTSIALNAGNQLAIPVVHSISAVGTPLNGTPQAPTAAQNFNLYVPDAATTDYYYFGTPPWETGNPRPRMQGNLPLDTSSVIVWIEVAPNSWAHYCQAATDPLATVWYCNSPSRDLLPGTNTLAATSVNEYGNLSTLGNEITIERVENPYFTAPTPANNSYSNDNTLNISGVAPYGNQLIIFYAAEGTFCDNVVIAVDNTFSCESGALGDGTYNYYAYVYEGRDVVSATSTVTIDTQAPGAPAILTTGTTGDSTPTISGTGETSSTITVYLNGSPIACVTAAVSDSEGNWSCDVNTPLTSGTYTISAVQTDLAGNQSNGGLPSGSSSLEVVLPPPPSLPPLAPPATPTPGIQLPTLALLQTPLVWTFTAGGDAYEPGDETDLVGSGLPVGSAVVAEFHSTPVALGSTIVATDGTFLLHVTIPEDATVGLHHFVVTLVTPEGVISTVEQAVTINLKPKGIAEAPIKNPNAVAATSAGAVGSERSDPAAPSSLTFSIRTVKDIVANPLIIGTAAAIGLVLLLLIAFPAELLNSTISEQYPRFSRRLPEVHTPWWDRFIDWLKRTPIVGGIVITGLAAFIFGFADPGFGFDVTSLRVVLSCALALFVVGYLASSISGAIVRRAWGLATAIELKPLGLILTVIGVVISRVLDFAPGFLIGLILGITLIGKTTVAQQAKAALVQVGVVFMLAMLGWLGYSFVVAALEPNSFVTALSFDTLVAITAEGITALFIGLLPFKFLDGQVIFQHSKVAWSAAFALVAAAFVMIIVPAAWGDTSGPAWLWTAFIIGFAVVAVGLYLYFRFWAPPIEEDEEAERAEHEKVNA